MTEPKKRGPKTKVANHVRIITLQPHSSWEAPTAPEIRKVMELAEWSTCEMAQNFGAGKRTAERWVAGESKIPYLAWCVLTTQAGLGHIWEQQ